MKTLYPFLIFMLSSFSTPLSATPSFNHVRTFCTHALDQVKTFFSPASESKALGTLPETRKERIAHLLEQVETKSRLIPGSDAYRKTVQIYLNQFRRSLGHPSKVKAPLSALEAYRSRLELMLDAFLELYRENQKSLTLSTEEEKFLDQVVTHLKQTLNGELAFHEDDFFIITRNYNIAVTVIKRNENEQWRKSFDAQVGINNPEELSELPLSPLESSLSSISPYFLAFGWANDELSFDVFSQIDFIHLWAFPIGPYLATMDYFLYDHVETHFGSPYNQFRHDTGHFINHFSTFWFSFFRFDRKINRYVFVATPEKLLETILNRIDTVLWMLEIIQKCKTLRERQMASLIFFQIVREDEQTEKIKKRKMTRFTPSDYRGLLHGIEASLEEITIKRVRRSHDLGEPYPELSQLSPKEIKDIYQNVLKLILAP